RGGDGRRRLAPGASARRRRRLAPRQERARGRDGRGFRRWALADLLPLCRRSGRARGDRPRGQTRRSSVEDRRRRARPGAAVVAANTGRAALVGEFFFPGRLVVLDHGLGLYTLYFHLDSVAVSEGERVERGQTIGGVGASGRATGPHLHFGAQVGAARVDPTALLGLTLGD